MSESSQPQQVNLAALSLEQLEMVKEQVENEIQTLSDSMLQLKHAATKYLEAKEAIQGLAGAEGKEILVPLTSSLYLPGKINCKDKVMVDIGTQYFIEMDLEQGQGFTNRKVQLIQDQVNKVQQAVNVKRNHLDQIIQVAQQKIQLIKQQQAAAAKK
ncbi:prefoldin subunit 5 [Heterostelium album PN500]|uniref:Prefoldin subunit 5 n=1 Tax=Heterostelium pallidum (strain ATCC 26659 / Pp 5 / PN500) TaxID=670386 RepID=D3BQ25_HETP5|nr:prefoldin subunit 5 [Heterostelium album PN500]EFA76576.1 prefoldin subunit 5 [Heterostelium album PN500]|eukprot:XP_020428708.1 prefoldin subunit 5 [Heterostelium album PN500]